MELAEIDRKIDAMNTNRHLDYLLRATEEYLFEEDRKFINEERQKYTKKKKVTQRTN